MMTKTLMFALTVTVGFFVNAVAAALGSHRWARLKLVAYLFVLLTAAPARADLILYATASGPGNNLFGTINVTTGQFSQTVTTAPLFVGLTTSTNGTIYGAGFDNSLYTATTSGVTQVYGTVTSPNNNPPGFWGLAASGTTLYGVDNFAGVGIDLYRITNSGTTSTLVGQMSAGGFANSGTGGLAFGPGGVLFYNYVPMGETAPMLFAVNTSTGALSAIGSGLGITSNIVLTLAYDGTTLYGIDAFSVSNRGIYTINTVNGMATQIGTVTGLPSNYTVDTTIFVNANAATFAVNTTADTQDAIPGNGICADSSGACSLRAAITEANALAGADTITLPAGTYTITLPTTGDDANAGGDFDLTSPMTINGAGPGTTIIQANALPDTATERVIHCVTAATAVVINDVTIRHGNSPIDVSGSGIRLETATTNLTLNRVAVTNNRSAGSGGGISIVTDGVLLAINDSTISSNSAGSSLAGSGGRGAGVNVAATATVTINSTTITENAINSSVSNTFGAGVNVSSAVGATVMITGSTISNNSSTSTNGFGQAGGIYNLQGTVHIADSSITGNTCSIAHAGIRTVASTGGPATTTITNCIVSNNTAPENGGGVTNVVFSTFDATTTITGSTISGNSATDPGGFGGGIDNFSTSSTGAATINLTNCTVSGNNADFGGGIYNVGAPATINLNYSTVASNTANSEGGGLYQDAGGVINVKNSIVADNTAPTGPDIFGPITSQNYNHVENTTGGAFLALANDVTGTDPQLGPLANNGGLTATHLPLGGSVVLNTIAGGTSECGTTVLVDQRGFTRPVGAGCEKGAVEVQLPQLAGAVSRKTHGMAGTFDINLPFSSPFGVECRSGGPNNSHALVFTFNNPVVSGSASVITGTGSVSGSPVFAGNTMTVNLINVTDIQLLTVTLSGVTDSFGQVLQNTSASAKFLCGDTNGNSSVSATDIGQTKAEAGSPVGAGNFRVDTNVNGSITASDIAQVKSRSGDSLP
ncbi:MAG: choice-of-anchor Q domain-containing protein [Chthoniobacterales bacterium]